LAKREEFDVCVVGTGAGGGVMIQQLTAAGFKVVALQRGPFLQGSDFDDDELATAVRDQVFSPNQRETYRFDEASPTVRGRFNATADCVGGTMTHWGGRSWRLRPEELQVLSHEGPVEGASLADWPISYEELEPFYEQAEVDFGVAGEAGTNPFEAPRKTAYPNPAHPDRASALYFADGAKKLGLHPFRVPLAINPALYGGRGPCRYAGACAGFGCPVHAKATTLSVSIPRALATGNLDLRPNSTALEVTVGPEGQAKSVRYLDWKRNLREVFARHFVVSGNAVGSAHLLLLSKSGSFPGGLANSSGLVGKNLTFHLRPMVGCLVDGPARGFTGVETHAAVDDFHASDPRRGFIRGGVVVETNDFSRQPIAYAVFGSAGFPGMRRRWGKDLKDFLRSFPSAVFLSAVLEDLPMEENRVDLSPDEKDEDGVPVPRITHRQHANDVAMHRWFEQRLADIAEATGARVRWLARIAGVTYVDEKIAMMGSTDLLGTCRMGKDPARSVLDPWCRTHDVKNLWVVDGSCFPTAGGYNPTLTILANAYRVADYFVREAKRQALR
jgi:choline dehydrogenase-like flavoprotein